MEFYIVYDKTTGEEKTRGQGLENSALLQKSMLPKHLATMVVSLPVFNSYPLDLEKIRAAAALQIDRAAEVTRLRYLTAGSGQAITYTAKVEEAKAYLADNSVSTPFLSAEASAVGMTVSDLVSEVLEKASDWTIIGARIEGARMGAKAALGKASNLAEVANAVAVDWPHPSDPKT
jgi:hypothetical protein